MPSIETLLLGTAILLIISILASKISTKLSVPGLLIFLFVGMLAGSEGIGGIYFDDPSAAQSLGIIALVFILFSGGLDTPTEGMRRILGRGIFLSTIGVLITAVIVAFFVQLLLDFSTAEAFLVGAIIASTDAAAVFSILRTQKIGLRGDTKRLLEFESGSNDPMAILLTVEAIRFLQQPEIPLTNVLLVFLQSMLIGMIVGLIIGHLTSRVINQIRLDADGLYPVFTISIVLLAYALAALLGGSGFLAVYVVGLVMSRFNFVHKNSLLRFHDSLAWLMQIVMFLVLGLLVFPSELVPIASTGILIAIILTFFARPVSVFIGLLSSQFTMRDKLLISWVGLRGATPIVLATFPLLAGIPESDVIFNIVFFVVLISMMLQGTTIIPVARFLGITTPYLPKPQYPFELVTNTNIRNELVEVPVTAGSMAINRQIVELNLPHESLVVLISRGQEVVVPNGSTVIKEGDILLVLADKVALHHIRETI